jgi:hypothetical protein
MSRGQEGTRGTGVFLGGRYSYDDLVAFGGIPENSVEVRSSDRIRHQHIPYAVWISGYVEN